MHQPVKASLLVTRKYVAQIQEEVHMHTEYCIHIIEYDSTLYVGMTRKQNGSPIPPIHYSFAKYRLWTSIKSKPAFRSRSQLIIEIIKLQASGKNVIEVTNWQKVKKLKGQNVGLLIFLYIFFNKATKVLAGAMVLIFT